MKWIAGIMCFIGFLVPVFLINQVMATDKVAASCSAADIQSAINACISRGGGTVTLPECDYTSKTPNGALWTSSSHRIGKTVVGSTPLRIKGQGSTKTKIGYSANKGAGIMWAFVGSGFREFSGMTLHGDGYSRSSGKGAITLAGAKDCLINDIVMENFAGPLTVFCGTQNLVVSNVIFNKVLYGGTYFNYVYGPCSYAKSDPNYIIDWNSRFGTNQYSVFFEDCTFYDSHHPVSLFTGASVVVRYSKFYPSGLPDPYQDNLDSHEPSYGDCDGAVEGEEGTKYRYDCDPKYGGTQHGGRGYEIYNNIFKGIGSTAWATVRLRSGFMIYHNNSVENYSSPVIVMIDNNSKGSRCTSGNGWPQDHTFKGDCGSGDGCCDKPEQVFIWGNANNTLCTGNKTPWDCCTGNGRGNCVFSITEESPGVTYYTRAPTVKDDGFSWTPYTYPHPLRSSGVNPPPEKPKAPKILNP